MFISTYISFLSFCLDLKTEAILLKWGVPHYGWYLNFILWTCGDLNLVKGLDAKRGGGIGSWGYTSALSCNIDTFRVASIGSSDNTGLTPDSDRKGREASSIDFFFFLKLTRVYGLNDYSFIKILLLFPSQGVGSHFSQSVCSVRLRLQLTLLFSQLGCHYSMLHFQQSVLWL